MEVTTVRAVTHAPLPTPPPNLFFGVRRFRFPLVNGALVLRLVVAMGTGGKRGFLGVRRGVVGGLFWGGGGCYLSSRSLRPRSRRA